jgi:hypothetical protein
VAGNGAARSCGAHSEQALLTAGRDRVLVDRR